MTGGLIKEFNKGTCLNLTLGPKLKGDWLQQHVKIYFFSPVCKYCATDISLNPH